MKRIPPSRGCFVCGVRSENPSSLEVAFFDDGAEVTADLRFESAHEGIRGFVHGGILSAVLDEALCLAAGTHGATALVCTLQLAVEFRRPVRVARPYRLRARFDEVQGAMLLARSEVVDLDERVFARATGRCRPIALRSAIRTAP